MIPVMIVPTLMHYDLLQIMLDSIDYPIEHLIVIDNGGRLESVRCENATKITLLNMPANLGCATSWNLGIKLTPFASWWLIASDDIIWNPEALSLYDKFMGDKTVLIESPTLHGKFSGIGIHETVINKIGLFDEFYFPGVGEEIQFMKRLNETDCIMRMIPGAYRTKAGRTREALSAMNPQYTAIFFNNLDSAGRASSETRGWSLENRRKCDPGPITSTPL